MARIESQISIDATPTKTGTVTERQVKINNEAIGAVALKFDASERSKKQASELEGRINSGTETGQDILEDLERDHEKRNGVKIDERQKGLFLGVLGDGKEKDESQSVLRTLEIQRTHGGSESIQKAAVGEPEAIQLLEERYNAGIKLQKLEEVRKLRGLSSKEKAEKAKLLIYKTKLTEQEKHEVMMLVTTRETFVTSNVGRVAIEGWKEQIEPEYLRSHGVDATKLKGLREKARSSFQSLKKDEKEYLDQIEFGLNQEVDKKSTQAAAVMLQNEDYRGKIAEAVNERLNNPLVIEAQEKREQEKQNKQQKDVPLISNDAQIGLLHLQVADIMGETEVNGKKYRALDGVGKSVKLDESIRTIQGEIDARTLAINTQLTANTGRLLTPAITGLEKERARFERQLSELQEEKQKLFDKAAVLKEQIERLRTEKAKEGNSDQSLLPSEQQSELLNSLSLESIIGEVTKDFIREQIKKVYDAGKAQLEEMRESSVDEAEKALYDQAASRWAGENESKRDLHQPLGLGRRLLFGNFFRDKEEGLRKRKGDFFRRFGGERAWGRLAVKPLELQESYGLNVDQIRKDYALFKAQGAIGLMREMLEAEDDAQRANNEDTELTRDERQQVFVFALDSTGEPLPASQGNLISYKRQYHDNIQIQDGKIMVPTERNAAIESKLQDKEWVAKNSQIVIENFMRVGLLVGGPDGKKPLITAEEASEIVAKYSEQLAPVIEKVPSDVKAIISEKMGEDALSTPERIKDTLSKLKGSSVLFLLLAALLGSTSGAFLEIGKQGLQDGLR